MTLTSESLSASLFLFVLVLCFDEGGVGKMALESLIEGIGLTATRDWPFFSPSLATSSVSSLLGAGDPSR